MSIKRICFVVTDAVSFNALYRGQLEYIRDNAGYAVTLVSGGSAGEIDKLKKRNVGRVVNLNFVRAPSFLRDFTCLLLLVKFFAFNRFDLILYSTPKALLLGSLAGAVTFQRRRVAIIRGRAYENFEGRKRKIFSFLDKLALTLSNKVVFISESLRKCYMQERIVNLNKTVLLGAGSSNGVNTDRFVPGRGESNTFTVLVVGRVCEDKGFFDLSEVLKSITSGGVQFNIVGAVEGEEIRLLLNHLLATYPFVTHYGSTDQVEDFFRQADLHLFLTHREGFGNVAIEAASCGVPTFAYDVVGVRDSVAEGVSGKCFAFGDTQSVSEAINTAAADNSFPSRYPHARSWAIQRFDQYKVWNAYLQFYRQMLKE